MIGVPGDKIYFLLDLLLLLVHLLRFPKAILHFLIGIHFHKKCVATFSAIGSYWILIMLHFKPQIIICLHKHDIYHIQVYSKIDTAGKT